MLTRRTFLDGALGTTAALAVSLWWGPGSRRLRVPTRRLVIATPSRAWLGWAPVDWGRKAVAVPLETVAIQGRQVSALDFSPTDFANAPAYAGQGTALPPGETIRIAVSR